MVRYEVLFLTVPEITGDETEAIKSYFTKSVRDVKGDLLSFERWGKYRLAYPVQHNDYGVYFLARFEVEQDVRDEMLKNVKDAFVFKFNTLVMKNMVHRLPSNGSLDYSRPESLEDTPQDVDSFLKKNDMGGLLKDNSAKKTEVKAEAETKEVEAVATEEKAAEATEEVVETENKADQE